MQHLDPKDPRNKLSKFAPRRPEAEPPSNPGMRKAALILIIIVITYSSLRFLMSMITAWKLGLGYGAYPGSSNLIFSRVANAAFHAVLIFGLTFLYRYLRSEWSGEPAEKPEESDAPLPRSLSRPDPKSKSRKIS